jgi:hypothetical protein
LAAAGKNLVNSKQRLLATTCFSLVIAIEPPSKAEELPGFWLVKVADKLSNSANYLTSLLKHGGTQLQKLSGLDQSGSPQCRRE